MSAMRRAETCAMDSASARKASGRVKPGHQADAKKLSLAKIGGTFSVKRQTGFGSIAILCFVLLYLPIATLVVYSFNAGPSIAIWEGFSWRWYIAAWNNAQIVEASTRSFTIASIAAVISTIAATMAALATTRTKPYR